MGTFPADVPALWYCFHQFSAMRVLAGFSPFLSPLASSCHPCLPSYDSLVTFALSADSWFAVELCVAALANVALQYLFARDWSSCPSADSWFAAALRIYQIAPSTRLHRVVPRAMPCSYIGQKFNISRSCSITSALPYSVSFSFPLSLPSFAFHCHMDVVSSLPWAW